MLAVNSSINILIYVAKASFHKPIILEFKKRKVATFSEANHSRILVKASCHIFRSQSLKDLEIKPGLKVPPSVFLDGSFTLLHQTAASSLFKVMLMIMKSRTKRGLVILTKMVLKMAVSRSEMTLKTGVGTPFLNRSRETKIG